MLFPKKRASGLPDHEWTNLTDAIEWLASRENAEAASGQAYEARAERMRGLVERLKRERQADHGYLEFPESLPTAPASALVEALEAHRAAWPPSAEALYRDAAELAADQERRVEHFDSAWQQLQAFARAGTVRLLGNLDPGPNAAHDSIPSHYFSSKRDVIAGDGRDCIRPAGPPFLAHTDEASYRAVLVHTVDLETAARGATNVKPGKKLATAIAAIRALWPGGVGLDLISAKKRQAMIEAWCGIQAPPREVPQENRVKAAIKALKDSGELA